MNTKRTPFARIISQYINKGLTSAEEIASLLSCSTRRVYKIVNEAEGHFLDWEAQTLCQHFSTQGHNELSRLFISCKYSFVPTGEVLINGSLEDETAAATKIMGRMLEMFDEKKKSEGLELCDKLEAVVKRKKAEFRNLD